MRPRVEAGGSGTRGPRKSGNAILYTGIGQRGECVLF